MVFFMKKREIFEELPNTKITCHFKIKCGKASSFICSFWHCLKITEWKSQSSNSQLKIILGPLKCPYFQNKILCSELLIYSVLPHNTLDYNDLSCNFCFDCAPGPSFPTLSHLYAHQPVSNTWILRLWNIKDMQKFSDSVSLDLHAWVE